MWHGSSTNATRLISRRSRGCFPGCKHFSYHRPVTRPWLPTTPLPPFELTAPLELTETSTCKLGSCIFFHVTMYATCPVLRPFPCVMHALPIALHPCQHSGLTAQLPPAIVLSSHSRSPQAAEQQIHDYHLPLFTYLTSSHTWPHHMARPLGSACAPGRRNPPATDPGTHGFHWLQTCM